MKKSLLTLLALVLAFSLSSLAFAAKAKAPKTLVFKGTIEAVTLADAVKGTKSEVIAAAKDKKMTFLVKENTAIYVGKGKTTLDKIQTGKKVTIRYMTTSEGVHEARSIRIAKK